MALIVSTQLKALAEDIVPAAPPGASAAQITARNNAVANTQDLVTKICQYLVDQLEIKALKTTLDTSLNTIFSAGAPVPNDGGAALQTAWKAATAAGAADDATQNNDGKGLIS